MLSRRVLPALVLLVTLAAPGARAADRSRPGAPPLSLDRPVRTAAPAMPGNPAPARPAGPEVFPPLPRSRDEARDELRRMLARPHAILFDGARFDPLADGVPDLSAFVPDPPGDGDLPADAPRLAIVQFDHAPGPADRAALAAHGVAPLFHVPRDAWLVRGSGRALAEVAGLAGVRWVGRYRAGYKVDRALGRLAAGFVPPRPLPGEGIESLAVDLLLAPGADADAVAERLRAAIPGIEILATWGDPGGLGVVTARVPRHGLRVNLSLLAGGDDVLAVEPHGEVHLHNDDAAWIGQSYDRWNRQDYSVTATTWNHGLLGEGEVIAIADTGVDPDTCWFEDDAGLPDVSSVPATGADRGPMPVDTSRRKIIGYNLLGSFQARATAYDVREGDPHGTWCAVSAVGDDTAHLADESDPGNGHHDLGDGMAPAAKLVVEDLGDDTGELVGLGLPIPPILDQVFEQEYEAGARISTNSWGVGGNRYDIFAFFADRMAWNHPDFLLVFSAGNGGPYAGTITSPATAKNVLAVGASDARIDPGDDLDPENLAEFSSRGPTADGRLKPDIVMSGNRVVTGTSDLGENGRTCARAEVSGTSFAAPLVAGYAALVREYYRKGFWPSGTARPGDGFVPSSALLRASLVAGARNMTGSAGEDYGPCILDTCDLSAGLCRNIFVECDEDADCQRCDKDQEISCSSDRECDLTTLQDDAPTNEQGWGRLHLDDVLYFDGDSRGLAVFDVPREEGVATGETWSREVYLDGRNEELRIVLAWTDPPALVASPTYLVDDLDLHVIAPDGTEYWGNAWQARNHDPAMVEYTAPGTRPDPDVDTIEMVRLPSWGAAAGLWKIEVVGESVPGSPWIDPAVRQGFAVVVVGPVDAGGGTVRFDRARLGCAGEAVLEVLDTTATGPLSVTVTTGSGDSETVTLEAIGGGRFRGSLPLAGNEPLAAGDGTLQVTDGDVLTATYHDADPDITATDRAVVDCQPPLEIGTPEVSGGCDDDGFLDGGEEVDLVVPLVNPGPMDLHGVRGRLVSRREDLFVSIAEADWGTVPAGSATPAASPFGVSLRDGIAPRSTVELALVVEADEWTAPREFPVRLLVEADEVHENGTWTEDFASASLACHDGSEDAPEDRWYFMDPDQDCDTTEDTWDVGFCHGNREAMLPSCLGQLLSPTGEQHHRLVSPKIVTGDPGTTTLLKRIRFLESYHFAINEDGKDCDHAEVRVYTNPDGRLLPTGYWRDRSADGEDETADLDPTKVSEWVVDPLPDATQLQLIFHVGFGDPWKDGVSCYGSANDEVRWLVDDIEVEYENIALVDDRTAACDPGCTAPATPAGVTVRDLGDGRVLVGWDPVDGADHYDVSRDGTFVGRVAAPDTALFDAPPGDGPWSWTVRAVDATGLCPSGSSPAAELGGGLPCHDAPAAPIGLAATDAAASTCEVDLSWQAVDPPCGGPVRYRVYRSANPEFVPGPETLLAEVDGTSFADGSVTTGFDDAGEPVGTAFTWEVRAVDTATGLEGPGARVTARAGGPRQAGTWVDDGGDEHVVKMTAVTLVDERETGARWTRSPIALHHGGRWSWWPDDDPMGDGRYVPLACLSLESPPIDLAADATPELHAWADYEIEWQWDGLVVELAVDGGDFAPIDPVGGYPGTFANTQPPPCQGAGGGTGNWVNGCDYPPEQGAITGPEAGGLSGWQEFVFDLSPWAGHTVRFRLNLSTDCGTDGGAVLDDLSVTGALLPTACTAGGCLPAPEFAGLLSVRDPDPDALTGVELTWGAVADWGGGGAGTFEVFRDGEKIATLDASARSYTDAGAADNREHTWQVIARSGGGCGLPSPSRARIRGRDCGAPGPSAEQAARLTVDLAPGRQTVVLDADGPEGAARWRFPWSHDPATVAGSPDVLVSGAPEARHAVAGDGRHYFYLVTAEPPEGCP